MSPYRVGLVDVDGKIPNAALMKLSAFHKARGDEVGWYSPLEGADEVYASRMFRTYASDRDERKAREKMDYLPRIHHEGGPGYSITRRLPFGDLDAIMPDYSLYPSCDYSIGRLTRGCYRRCPWCIVTQMDGETTQQVAELRDFWGKWYGHRVVRLLDDNVLKLPDAALMACLEAWATGIKLHWDALDIRLIDSDLAKWLWRTSDGNLRFSFDLPEHEQGVRRGVELLRAAGASLSHLRFYVLTGFNTTAEQDAFRLDVIRDLGVRPFVQCFEDATHKPTRAQRQLRRWANRPQLFTSCSFEDFVRDTP